MSKVMETLILGVAIIFFCAGMYSVSASRVFPRWARLPIHWDSWEWEKKKQNRKRKRKR